MLDGEADSFALACCPGLRPRWLFDLTEEAVEELWQRTYRGLCREKQVDYSRFMFGGGDIPWCAGYRLVQKYLSGHNMDFPTLLKAAPGEILAAIQA